MRLKKPYLTLMQKKTRMLPSKQTLTVVLFLRQTSWKLLSMKLENGGNFLNTHGLMKRMKTLLFFHESCMDCRRLNFIVEIKYNNDENQFTDQGIETTFLEYFQETYKSW